jgi:hypothetical protein
LPTRLCPAYSAAGCGVHLVAAGAQKDELDSVIFVLIALGIIGYNLNILG